MKTLIMGVWHPYVLQYGEDYFFSLNNQSDDNFDTLIITDQSNLPVRYQNRRQYIFKAQDGLTKADIRYLGIKYAVEHKYQILIFTDCDDFYSEERVKNAKMNLGLFDIYVNNLTLITETKQIIKDKVYKSDFKCSTFYDLLKGNHFGMSHTAIKLNALPSDFYIPKDLIAVDWWIFSLLLLNNRTSTFDENTVTYYRQHSMNTIGMNTAIDKQKLNFGIKVKTMHYHNLLEYSKANNFKMQEKAIIIEIEEMGLLEKKLQNNSFVKKYIEIINKNYDSIWNGWWSEILTYKEWEKYA